MSRSDRDNRTRIAIVSSDKCKPKKCRQECKRRCPVNIGGSLCVEVTPDDKVASISEALCIGCGICVNQCPFSAITIINLPKELEKETSHRYGANGFKLHRLPLPKRGQIVGLVGSNGLGKSTAIKILAGRMMPNLGRLSDAPPWEEIITYYRGSELQNYFAQIEKSGIIGAVKPQYVEQIPRTVKGTIRSVLTTKGVFERAQEFLLTDLTLNHLLDRSIDKLSGGELQRFAILMTILAPAQTRIFDEMSSYLDVKQRLAAAKVIRQMIDPSIYGEEAENTYVMVVEHDLAILDYLSDSICILYGQSNAYGVVAMPAGVREGINQFLSGWIPAENMRIRPEALTFSISQIEGILHDKSNQIFTYPALKKDFLDENNKIIFSLTVEPGSYLSSQCVLLLGENGTGKSTLVRLMAGLEKVTDGEMPELMVSYKPQMISPKFEGTVRQLLHKKIPKMMFEPQFNTDVLKPLCMEDIYDDVVLNLNGGALQKLAICLALGQPADVYLLDEPSSYLDVEMRIIVARVIKRFIMHTKRTAFIVEHDFLMATYLADSVILFEGTPGVSCVARSPQPLLSGMNTFLKMLNVTYRRDPNNLRPRINKINSVRDREQKQSGQYFFTEE